MFAGGCRCGRYGVVNGDFAVGDADKDPLRLEDPGYAAIPASYKGGAVSRPHHSLLGYAGVPACLS